MHTSPATAAPTASGSPHTAAMPDELHRTLWTLVEASTATAGALCLFDEDGGILRLAAEVGLSDEGCRTLRAIHARTETWTVPLRCVLERRIYLLEDTAAHPVPPLVEAAGPIASVACIPLAASERVWGSVILISTPPLTLTSPLLRELQPRIDDITTAVTALHAHVVSVSARHPALQRPLDAVAHTAGHAIHGALGGARRLLESTVHLHVPVVDRLVRHVRGRDARVDSHLRQLDRMAHSFWQRLRLMEIEAQAYEEADTALRGRLYDAEARVSRERNRTQILERERLRLAADLECVLAREQDTHRAAASVVAQGSFEREAALRSAQERMTRAEQARAATAEELEATRGQLVALQADVLRMTETVRNLHQEQACARQEVETARAEERRSAEALQEARDREAALAAQVAALEARRSQAPAGQQVDAAALEAHDAGLRERLDEAEAHLTRERQRASALDDDRRRTAVELADAVAREQHLRAELAAAIERSAVDREDSLRRASHLVEEAEQARAAAVAESEATRAALAHFEQSAAAAREEARQARARAELLEAAHSTATAEQERLSSALDDARARTAEATACLADMEESPPPTTPDAASSPPVRTRVHRDHLPVAILDTDASWGDAASAGMEVRVLPPTPDAVPAITGCGPTHVVANLLLPGVFDTLMALRAAGCTLPVHGCLARPGQDDAVMLGAFEISKAPLDVDDILERLGHLAARGMRVLAAGANVNAFISLREGLARAGYSVAIAWDAKQAVDVIGIVRPQATIIDLGLPPGGGAPLVVKLAVQDPPPPTVLIPDGRDPAPLFARALAASSDTVHPLTRGLCLARIDHS